MQNKGKLITIEGIDGSGKSTLAKNLYQELIRQQHNAILTLEPGKTFIGEKIKDLLNKDRPQMCSKTEFLLFAANRSQHFEELVIPALQNGKIVISDRMGDSSIAYQGYGLNLDIKMLETINIWAMNNIKPDLTLYIRLDEKAALSRTIKRKEALTPFEKEKLAFWKRVIEGYEKIFKDRVDVVVLDGRNTPEELTHLAKNAILSTMGK